eukprot:scaffold4957_cov97-Isochrysis_galbana.AAC.4
MGGEVPRWPGPAAAAPQLAGVVALAAGRAGAAHCRPGPLAGPRPGRHAPPPARQSPACAEGPESVALQQPLMRDEARTGTGGLDVGPGRGVAPARVAQHNVRHPRARRVDAGGAAGARRPHQPGVRQRAARPVWDVEDAPGEPGPKRAVQLRRSREGRVHLEVGGVGADATGEARRQPGWRHHAHVRHLRVGAAQQVLLAGGGVNHQVRHLAVQRPTVSAALAPDERLDDLPVVAPKRRAREADHQPVERAQQVVLLGKRLAMAGRRFHPLDAHHRDPHLHSNEVLVAQNCVGHQVRARRGEIRHDDNPKSGRVRVDHVLLARVEPRR